MLKTWSPGFQCTRDRKTQKFWPQTLFARKVEAREAFYFLRDPLGTFSKFQKKLAEFGWFGVCIVQNFSLLTQRTSITISLSQVGFEGMEISVSASVSTASAKLVW